MKISPYLAYDPSELLSNRPWITEPFLEKKRTNTQAHQSTNQPSNRLVPAAAQWVFHAGLLLFKCEEEIEPSHDRGDPLRGGVLWEGKHGFCKKRWEFWKSRFMFIIDGENLDTETRKVAAKAVKAMNQIERDD